MRRYTGAVSFRQKTRASPAIHERHGISGAGPAGEGALPERAKQDVSPAAPMDGFTAVRERALSRRARARDHVNRS